MDGKLSKEKQILKSFQTDVIQATSILNSPSTYLWVL